MKADKVKADKENKYWKHVDKIKAEGIYTSRTENLETNEILMGTLTIKNVTDKDGKIIGKKSDNSGSNHHHETFVYNRDSNTSTHASKHTHASHQSKVVKANNKSYTETGVGLSYTMQKSVEFKRIVTKKGKDIKVKILFKDDNDKDKYVLKRKVYCKFVSDLRESQITL
jgi:hypothetical protein